MVELANFQEIDRRFNKLFEAGADDRRRIFSDFDPECNYQLNF